MTFNQFATAFQAFGPTIATSIFATATTLITVHFNRVQARLANEKLRRDFYERRYKVWQNAQQLSEMIINCRAVPDTLDLRVRANTFLMSIQEAEFIIQDDDLLNRLQVFSEKATEALDEIIGLRSTPETERNSASYKLLWETREVILKQRMELTMAFRRVLQITDLI